VCSPRLTLLFRAFLLWAPVPHPRLFFFCVLMLFLRFSSIVHVACPSYTPPVFSSYPALFCFGLFLAHHVFNRRFLFPGFLFFAFASTFLCPPFWSPNSLLLSPILYTPAVRSLCYPFLLFRGLISNLFFLSVYFVFHVLSIFLHENSLHNLPLPLCRQFALTQPPVFPPHSRCLSSQLNFSVRSFPPSLMAFRPVPLFGHVAIPLDTVIPSVPPLVPVQHTTSSPRSFLCFIFFYRGFFVLKHRPGTTPAFARLFTSCVFTPTFFSSPPGSPSPLSFSPRLVFGSRV